MSKQFWAGILFAVGMIGAAARNVSTLWLVILALAIIATLGLVDKLPWAM